MKEGVTETRDKGNPLATYGLLFTCFFIYSWSTVCAKLASGYAMDDPLFYVFIGLDFLALGLYAVLWQQALKRTSLIAAMSSKGVVVILGLLWSVLLFGESITPNNLIGAVLIVGGILVVSRDG